MVRKCYLNTPHRGTEAHRDISLGASLPRCDVSIYLHTKLAASSTLPDPM